MTQPAAPTAEVTFEEEATGAELRFLRAVAIESAARLCTGRPSYGQDTVELADQFMVYILTGNVQG